MADALPEETKKLPFECEFCGKGFDFQCRLNVHKRMHTGEKPYSCEICHKRFVRIEARNIHKRIHTGDLIVDADGFIRERFPYHCEFCDKTFDYQCRLDVHRRLHTGERPYSCDLCDKSFTDKRALNVHKKYKHSEEILRSTEMKGLFYQCEFCKKTFVFKSQMNNHLRLHAGEKPYSCNICHQEFSRVEVLNIHLRIHEGELPYSCELCYKQFAFIEQLGSHKRTHATARPPVRSERPIFRCEFCEKGFAYESRLKVHRQIHTKPYFCDICQRRFARKYVLRNHVEKAHGIVTNTGAVSSKLDKSSPKIDKASSENNKALMLKCIFCEKRVMSINQMTVHLQEVHGQVSSSNGELYAEMVELNLDAESKSSVNDSVINEIAKPNTQPSYACEHCKRTFPTISLLEDHQQMHVDTNMSTNSNPFSLDENLNLLPLENSIMNDFTDLLTPNTEMSYACEFCGKTFATMRNMKDHQRIHSDVRPFSCDICNKTFLRRGDCNVHRKIHTGEKKFSCDVCGKRFLKKWPLKIHKMSHARKKKSLIRRDLPHKCEFCFKSFAWQSGLVIHRRIHTGEKPYSCDICSKRFSRRGHVNIHRNIHLGERPFKCKTCNRGYTRRENLTLHRKLKHPNEKAHDYKCKRTRRTSFECVFCGKKFTDKTLWTMHQEAHLGEKSFFCKKCGKRYSSAEKLRVHRQLHPFRKANWNKIRGRSSNSGDQKKSHECASCGKTFITAYIFGNHTESHVHPEWKFSCLICMKPFSDRAQLTVHLQEHKDKPFFCVNCGDKYVTLSELVEHNEILHMENALVCEFCDRSFLTEYQLDTHMRAHRLSQYYPCKICKKAFSYKSLLFIHMKNHLEENHESKMLDNEIAVETILNVDENSFL